MDIKVMSQGGQVNLDSSMQKAELSKGVNSIKGQDNFITMSRENRDVENKKESNNINEKELNKALQKLNGFLSDEKAHAELSMYEGTNRVMVTVYDKDDKVVMQIPSKKVLDMVDKMSQLLGVSVDEKA